MDPSRPDPEEIFHAARRIADPQLRLEYLAHACSGDAALRGRIEALLRADAEASGFLRETPGPTPRPDTPNSGAGPAEQPGDIIGRYELLELIGEGGFGSVWLAEQGEPVKRSVALKIVKLGMDTRQVIARFEAERQALAMMDHPGIAKVLDAGATGTGRPYFVMEYIRGAPLLEYCDSEGLDTEERLRLFIQVCHAVQHAHQKGIIHRDIKPSNVLVALHDGVPVPKVIDFGIAKATNAELTTKTLFTQHRQMIGTPAYMSPEQAELSGVDIDTRSDIYSLGVLLYELLTGATPFDTQELMSKGLAEMMRIIREVEPPKPSTRVTTVGEAATPAAAGRRTSDTRRLGALLRGDLDWIVMKCLEKDRSRRYETANALAEDIRRHLDDEPVTAGPPTTGYRVRKFVRRNRSGVIAAALVVLTLSLGVAGTTAGMFWALAQKSQAERAEAGARAVSLDKAAQDALGKDPAEAVRLASEACKLEEWRGGELLWQYLDTLARAHYHANDPASAVAAEERALRIAPAGREVMFWNRLGNMYKLLGDHQMKLGEREEAVSAYERGVELRVAATQLPDADPGMCNHVAWTLLNHPVEELRNAPRALRIAAQACAAEEAAGGDRLWWFLDTLALAQHMSGDTAAALQTQRRAAALAPDTELDTNLAAFQQRIEEYEAALAATGAEAAPVDDLETSAPAPASGG